MTLVSRCERHKFESRSSQIDIIRITTEQTGLHTGDFRSWQPEAATKSFCFDSGAFFSKNCQFIFGRSGGLDGRSFGDRFQ